MQNNKKILIICYSFPPFPGIGGRRWAKFSKYLTKNDFEVFVIGAKYRSGNKSNWTNDVTENKHIHYFPVKTKFYDFFHDHNFNFIKKVKFKLSQIYLRNKFKGNYYDKVLASSQLFYEKARQLIIENNIKNVVITIAPNRLVEVGIKLKKEFPNINLIIDVRDPWNILLDDWDHKTLNKEQKEYELQTELTAAKTADVIFSVYNVVIDFYNKHFPERKQNYIYVPNGFDKDDLYQGELKIEKQAIKYFVYAGILYDISIHLFEEFLQQIIALKNENKNTLNDVQFHFYISEPEMFKQKVEQYQLADYVKFFKQVPLAQIQNIIANSIGTMLFLPPGFEFSLSTKFYEYLNHNKKILLFSNPGEVAELVEKHQIGYVMLPNKMYNPFKKGVEEITSGKELPVHTFNLQDYSIEKLTEKIIPYFK